MAVDLKQYQESQARSTQLTANRGQTLASTPASGAATSTLLGSERGSTLSIGLAVRSGAGSRPNSGLNSGVKKVDAVSFAGVTGAGQDTDLPLNLLSAWQPTIGGSEISTDIIADIDVSSDAKWESPGKRGRTPVETFLTRELADVDITLKVYADHDGDNRPYGILREYVQRFLLAKNSGALVSISHPATDIHGINAITIRNVKGPKYDMGEMAVKVWVKCREWTPQPPKSAEKTLNNADIKPDPNVKLIPDLTEQGKPPEAVYKEAFGTGWGKF